MMSKFDKYKHPKNIDQLSNQNISVFDKYRKPKAVLEDQNVKSNSVTPYGTDRYGVILPEEYQTPVEDDIDNMVVAGKAFLKGAGSLADLPKAAMSGLEAIATSKGQRDLNLQQTLSNRGSAEDNIIVPDYDFISSEIPDTTDARKYLKEKTGLDLEPNPINPEQKLISNVFEIGGAFATPYKSLEMVKEADLGGNKLAALLQRYTPTFGKTRRTERQIKSLVDDLTKGKDLERLTNFKADGLDVVPVTAEVALNKDISNLHNVYAPNSSTILNKQKQNDAILRGKIDKIGVENYNPTVEEVGSEGRNFFNTEVGKLKKIRKEASDPYYQAQRESQNLYPVTNFETAINQGIADNTGDLEKLLQRYSDILPNKNASLLKKLRGERAGLQKKTKISSKKSEIDINKLSPAAREQLMLENPDFQKIADLDAKIAELEGGKYRPAHIDSTRRNIKKDARSLPVGSEERTFLNSYAAELKKDLEATDTGAKASEIFREHSPKINEVEQDRYLKNFIKKDKNGDFKTSVGKLPKDIFSAPVDSVIKFKNWTEGTRTDELTRAYLRDRYLGKALDVEGLLPSYDKSSGFLKQQRPRLEVILNKNEMSELDKINEYLKNRNIVLHGNKSHGSATNAKNMLDAITKKYIGEQTVKKHPIIAYTPVLNKVFKGAAKATKPNPKYDVLYEFLTDPIYAQDVLKQKPVFDFSRLKTSNKGYIPQVLQLRMEDN